MSDMHLLKRWCMGDDDRLDGDGVGTFANQLMVLTRVVFSIGSTAAVTSEILDEPRRESSGPQNFRMTSIVTVKLASSQTSEPQVFRNARHVNTEAAVASAGSIVGSELRLYTMARRVYSLVASQRRDGLR
jgi:hypothetical protein